MCDVNAYNPAVPNVLPLKWVSIDIAPEDGTGSPDVNVAPLKYDNATDPTNAGVAVMVSEP